MKKTKPFYYLIILIITFLTYRQSIGLNAFLIALISVLYLSGFNLSKRSPYWWLSAGLWVLSGLSLFLSNTEIGGALYFLTSFHFISVNTESKRTFPFSFLNSILSFILGIGHFFMSKKTPSDNPDIAKKSEQFVKRFLMYSLPLLIVIVFFKLYQVANPDFEEMTAFINLDFIEGPFVLLYILFMVFLYGLYNYYSWSPISELDQNLANNIQEDYTDTIEERFGRDSEQKMATLLIGTLSLLLIAFLVVDAYTLFFKTSQSLSHSDYVHQGVNVLITSIVFVILIVVYVFRGHINFLQNKLIKYMTYGWLGLNVILTGFNFVKNYNYIETWGLTHKRIGVYIYLSLCLIGLSITIYKVAKRQSFIFIIRRVSISFITILVILTNFNWNAIIARYNLADDRFDYSNIDLTYNTMLGPESYPYVLRYVQTHPDKIAEHHKHLLDHKIAEFQVLYGDEWKDFPSLKVSEILAYRALEDYHPAVESSFYSR